MLRELSIRNFAIIDDLSISFEKGLTVLTGETGAGKSIIINAVNLILGGRGTPSLIRTGAKSAELEAMWAWYREWSQILRLELDDRRLLRGMGLASPRRRSE